MPHIVDPAAWVLRALPMPSDFTITAQHGAGIGECQCIGCTAHCDDQDPRWGICKVVCDRDMKQGCDDCSMPIAQCSHRAFQS